MGRVAISGASGQLGRQLVRAFTDAGHEVRALSRADFASISVGGGALDGWWPEIVVNSAAWTDVDGCARDPDRAMQVNADGAGAVAAYARSLDALVVQISTNEVFGGAPGRSFGPDDEPQPINAYGRSKLAGERAVAAANPHHLIVRTAWLFGPGGTNFVTKILAAGLRARDARQPLRLVSDETGNPTWTPDLADVIVGLVASPPAPIVHVAGTPPATRLEWGEVALEAAGIRVQVQPVPLSAFERASTPPPHAVLAPSSGVPEIDWRAATIGYVQEELS